MVLKSFPFECFQLKALLFSLDGLVNIVETCHWPLQISLGVVDVWLPSCEPVTLYKSPIVEG